MQGRKLYEEIWIGVKQEVSTPFTMITQVTKPVSPKKACFDPKIQSKFTFFSFLC